MVVDFLIVNNPENSYFFILPQVVKTARTMKQAVDILTPYIENPSDGKDGSDCTQPKVLLATVKGDVHDIGKNIVSVVMACNGYRIIDLGVMVSAEDIVAAALREKVDFIGLSGLITPSLTEMVNTAQALKKAGVCIPLMIGGATTSELHTALKIAPEYDGPVLWMHDASQNVIAVQKLNDAQSAELFTAQLRKVQQELRTDYEQAHPTLLSLEDARKKKFN